MKTKLCLFALAFAPLGASPQHTVVNSATAQWARDSATSESVVLREDDRATEYLVRVPAGHAFRPHRHSVNERIVLLEGRLSVQAGQASEAFLDTGGYTFLPAREAQRLKCVSSGRCAFYVFWDGKLDFLPAE